MKFDVVVIGGGSAGMAAALTAYENGARVALLERDNRLGGILNQCVHNGFGLKYFKRELTGPEYAEEFVKRVKDKNITVMLNTTVTEVNNSLIVNTISPKGILKIEAKAIILAMGCRERPPAAISLCGTRPAGVLTAGAAQKLINTSGKMVGKNIVIVGSGDIGLIMARRLHYEGAKVLGVYEIAKTPSGLKRNIVQCLNDYDIPLFLGETVTEVVGQDRVEGVYVAKVNDDFSFDMTTKKFIECDTILLSVGLIPENDLIAEFIKMNPLTGGADVDEFCETENPGIFSCGNVLHVHDIVDNVSLEGEIAGKNASLFAAGKLNKGIEKNISYTNNFRYVLPKKVYEGEGFVTLKYRVDKVYRNPTVKVFVGDKLIASRKYTILLPAEMEIIMVDKSKITGDINLTLEVETK